MEKNRVRELRFKKQITQDDIFVETRIWPSKISRIERGILPATDQERKLISKALGVREEEAFPAK